MQQKMIITHDGQFHAEEILACVMLQKVFPNSFIYRTRNEEIIQQYIDNGEVIAVVDVFQKYDAVKGFFDHNQANPNDFIPEVKNSSAGLVFKHYCYKILDVYDIKTQNPKRAIEQIYFNFISMVDAKAEGIDIECKVDLDPLRDEVDNRLGLNIHIWSKKGFHWIYAPNIALLVSKYTTFEEAFSFVKDSFHNFMLAIKKWIHKYDVAKKLLNDKRKTLHADNLSRDYNRQILLTEDMGNIDQIICELEKEFGLDIKFTIDYDGFKYYIFAVAKFPQGFNLETYLSRKRMGLEYKELIKICGATGIVYPHPSGLMGMRKTLDDAMEMCYQLMN